MVELVGEIKISNQNLKFIIQLDKIEKNINEMFNNVKKLFDLLRKIWN